MDKKQLEQMYEDAIEIVRKNKGFWNGEAALPASNLVQAWATIEAAEIKAAEQKKIAAGLDSISSRMEYYS